MNVWAHCGHSSAHLLASRSPAPHQQSQELNLPFLPRAVPRDRPSARAATAASHPPGPPGASSQPSLAGVLPSRAAALRASAHFHAAHYHCLLFYKGPEHCSHPRAGPWELLSSAVPNEFPKMRVFRGLFVPAPWALLWWLQAVPGSGPWLGL